MFTQNWIIAPQTDGYHFSLKASFEAINLGLQTHEFALGRDLVGLAGSSGDAMLSAPSTPTPSGSATQKRKKSHSRTPSTSLVSAPTLLVSITILLLGLEYVTVDHLYRGCCTLVVLRLAVKVAFRLKQSFLLTQFPKLSLFFALGLKELFTRSY